MVTLEESSILWGPLGVIGLPCICWGTCGSGLCYGRRGSSAEAFGYRFTVLCEKDSGGYALFLSALFVLFLRSICYPKSIK